MPETPPYCQPINKVLEAWGTSVEHGLSKQEAGRRRQRYGPNALRAARRKPWWAVLLAQFESLVVLLLLAAAAAAVAFGRTLEGIAIAAALVINAAIGFVTELKAVRSVESLRRLGQARATVVRDGRERDVRADMLVPGDVVRLQEGDVVAADVRLATSESLECDESALTGESVPTAKTTEAIAGESVPLAERRNMVFKGTAVTRGSASGVVVATGMATEIGRISELVQEAGEQATPLEKRLNRLGQRLIYLVVGLAVIIGGSGIAAGQDVFVMFETAIALAIAAVPEGLPIVSTVALGRGVWRMARRNALVKHLSAVETLGAANVILSDKTGTLTENRMALQKVALPSADVTSAGDDAGLRTDDLDDDARAALTELLRTAVLCSNARPVEEGERDRGDPTEIGLVRAALGQGIGPEELEAQWPRLREESFDPETQMMATLHEVSEGDVLVAVKGSPEAVLQACTRVAGSDGSADMDDAMRRQWRERNEAMAGDGLRVLAVARKRQHEAEGDPYSGLTLLGLVGLHDPPRPEVPEAIARCRAAGIRVVMVTGDQPGTAGRIAHAVGITEDRKPTVLAGTDIKDEPRDDHIREVQVFARVSPEQKFDIVSALQAAGAVVGMTGDGVNDAPALKKADIGIAMGQRGTEVAREAADIVLKDDAFETIVTAVEYGRTIFNNIRKFIVFLLSGNLGQILAVATPALLGAPLPLAPLQILFLNLVLDVFPALAIGVGRSDPTVMREPPREPSEPVLTRNHWLAIGGFGVAIATATLVAFALALAVFDMAYPEALAVSFLTYGMARLWHVFNMRSLAAGFISNDITRNPWVWAALALSGLLLAAAVYLPPSAAILGVAALDARGWLLVLPASLLPLALGQAGLAIASLRGGDRARP